MSKSRFVFDKFAKLIEQGLVNYKDISSEIVNILKSKRDEIVFKMKLTSKEETDILSKRVDNLEKKIETPIKQSRQSRQKQSTSEVSAADLVSTKTTTVDATRPQKVWTEREIAAMSMDEFDKFEQEINEAISEGRVVKQ